MRNKFYQAVLGFFLFLAAFTSCDDPALQDTVQTGDEEDTIVPPDQAPDITLPQTPQEDPEGTPEEPDTTGESDGESDEEPPKADPEEDEGTVLPEDPESQDPELPVPKAVLKASESCVPEGKKVTIQWEVTQADQVFFEGKEVGLKGKKELTPKFLKTYRLTAFHGDKRVDKSVQVGIKSKAADYELGVKGSLPQEIASLAVSVQGHYLALNEGGALFAGQYPDTFRQLYPNAAVSSWSAIAIDPVDPKVLFAATDGRVYRSTDGGSSWPDVIPVRRNNIDLAVNTLYVSPADPHLVFIGVSGGAFVLDTQARSLNLMTDLNKKEVLLFAANEEQVIAKTDAGLKVSANQGDSWSSDEMPEEAGDALVLAFQGDVLWLGAENGLYKRHSGKWEPIGLIKGGVRDLFVSEDSLLVASESGLYSHKGGEWIDLETEPVSWILQAGQEALFIEGEQYLNLVSKETSSSQCPADTGFTLSPALLDAVRNSKSPLISLPRADWSGIRPINGMLNL